MVTLIVLDGFGIRKEQFGNAIKAAGTPNLDKLFKKYPSTLLKANGEAVGLPKNQMGNSEVGHLTIGSGRCIWQELMKINKDIENNSLQSNKALIKAFKHAEKNKSSLHLIGLLSDGGVHSHIDHMFALLRYSKNYNIPRIYIHAITDGRDCDIHSAINFVKHTNQFLKDNNIQNTEIVSICGRVYAMDREKKYSRIKMYYDMLVNEKCSFNDYDISAIEALQESYNNGKSDEFVLPRLLNKKATIKDNDSVIFYNFRADRAIELTNAFTNQGFKEFKTKSFTNLLFTTMEVYADQFKNINTLYKKDTISNTLAEVLSKHGKKQFHIAETTKYAHVTFYFNGWKQTPHKNEEWKLIQSEDTEDFSYYPKMKAMEITENVFEAITSQKYDFILVNYSNADMIGHTGNFEATKQAISCVEKQAYALALATLMAGGECIITADHGNAELMFDKQGNKITSHTSSFVPCILVSEKHKKVKLGKSLSLANIAPTILKLLNIEIPKEMQKPLF